MVSPYPSDPPNLTYYLYCTSTIRVVPNNIQHLYFLPCLSIFSTCVWITTNCRKFLKRWEYHTTWPDFWEICMQVKKQQLELDMQNQTGSKYGKESVKAAYCHPADWTYMQTTSCEMPCWIKNKIESPGEISIRSDLQMTPPLWRKAKRN